jgi:hypothetical protein
LPSFGGGSALVVTTITSTSGGGRQLGGVGQPDHRSAEERSGEVGGPGGVRTDPPPRDVPCGRDVHRHSFRPSVAGNPTAEILGGVLDDRAGAFQRSMLVRRAFRRWTAAECLSGQALAMIASARVRGTSAWESNCIE